MLHTRVHAKLTPDKPAYIMAGTGEVVTFSQLEERANRCSHFFREAGLQPKDHICIYMDNNARFLEISSAAKVAGLTYTLVSKYLNSSEIEYIVNDCQARLLIVSIAVKEVAAQLVDRCPSIEKWVMVGGTIDGYLSYEEEMAKYPDTPIPECPEGRDMLYSSGTTGRPKGIVKVLPDVPFGTQDASEKDFARLFRLDSDTVYLSPSPLYHAAPHRFCMWSLRLGGTIIVMEKYDSVEALSLIEKYRVTHAQWVPTMMIRMLKLPEEERNRFDLSSMKIAIHSAAMCPVDVKEKMIQWWGPIIYEYYSATEGTSLFFIDSEEWLAHKGSVGKCYRGIPHIVNELQEELPIGEVGTVYIENGFPFKYLNDPEKTAESQNAKGWVTLGDIGHMDSDGYLYLTDRRTDMIISGGINIYPQEVENALVIHPKVEDVAVFGIPHEEFGQQVKAVVKRADFEDSETALETELLEYCYSKLAKIKCPKSIDFRDELPRTPTGKLMKRLLVGEYLKQ